MAEEKQQHERLTGSLLEHAGRLSHKYHGLADDYDALQHRWVRWCGGCGLSSGA
jgi:hypothetical protein